MTTNLALVQAAYQVIRQWEMCDCATCCAGTRWGCLIKRIAAFGATQRADTLEQAISTVKAYKPPPTTLYYSTADMLEHIVAALRAARSEGT